VSFAEAAELDGVPAELGRSSERVELVPLPPGSIAARLLAIGSRRPYGVHRFASAPMRAAVAGMLAREGFDCILCDDVYNLENVPLDAGVPVVLNKHDLVHVIMERFLVLETNLGRRAYGALEVRKLRRWEAQACAAASGVLVVSAEDERVIHRLVPGARIAIAPNVVDVDHCPPAADAAGSPHESRVLYVGAMDWHPNTDAVRFFAREILPRLRAKVPAVRFRVAGRSPSGAFRREVERVAPVEFTGTVPDMRPEIASATVCVVPLRIGSGTRLKILEAAAMEKAIVSTRLGAEGLGLVDGEEIVLADDPDRFATAVADLLADPARRQALGRAARLRVAKEYGLPALQTAVRQALQRFVAPARRRDSKS
jgi:glycosyltransferase involved in cell wall biosynthesis